MLQCLVHTGSLSHCTCWQLLCRRKLLGLMFSTVLKGNSPCVGVRSSWHDRSAGPVVSLGTGGTLQLGHSKDGEAALLPPVAECVGM